MVFVDNGLDGLSRDRDEVNAFKAIVTEGWANRSSGDVESHVGHFALVLIDSTDATAFDDLWETDEFKDLTRPDAGNYLFTEDSDGNGVIFNYRSQEYATKAFEFFEGEYGDWLTADEDDLIDTPPVDRMWVCLESGTYGHSQIVSLDTTQMPVGVMEDFEAMSDSERIEYARDHGRRVEL